MEKRDVKPYDMPPFCYGTGEEKPVRTNEDRPVM